MITSDSIVKSMPLPPIDGKEKPVLDWAASQNFKIILRGMSEILERQDI